MHDQEVEDEVRHLDQSSSEHVCSVSPLSSDIPFVSFELGVGFPPA